MSQNGDLERIESTWLMIDPKSMGVLVKIMLGWYDADHGEPFFAQRTTDRRRATSGSASDKLRWLFQQQS